MALLCDDVWLDIAKYIDIETYCTLLKTCKHMYLLFNLPLVKMNIANKVLYELNLNIQVGQNDFSTLLLIYSHFKNHKNTCLVDFVFYAMENQKYQYLFIKKLLMKCTFKCYRIEEVETRFSYKRNYNVIDRNVISLPDMQYLLVHSNYDILQSVLEYFQISSELIYYTISRLLTLHPEQSYIKINKLIDYFLLKNSFNGLEPIDSMYFHKILVDLITFCRLGNILHGLNKGKFFHVHIDFQTLMNKCIETNNVRLLEKIHCYVTSHTH